MGNAPFIPLVVPIQHWGQCNGHHLAMQRGAQAAQPLPSPVGERGCGLDLQGENRYVAWPCGGKGVAWPQSSPMGVRGMAAGLGFGNFAGKRWLHLCLLLPPPNFPPIKSWPVISNMKLDLKYNSFPFLLFSPVWFQFNSRPWWFKKPDIYSQALY